MSWRDLDSDISEIFGDCQADMESALYRTHQHRLGVRRETYRLDHAARRRAHRRHKQYERRITAELKARRAARGRPYIKPIGRPVELERRYCRPRAA